MKGHESILLATIALVSCMNRNFNAPQSSAASLSTSPGVELQEKINATFASVFPEISALDSTNYEDYRAVLARATPEKLQALGQKSGEIMQLLVEHYQSPQWAFNAHVLNLPSTGNLAWDTRSRFINDVICATNETSTCTTGQPQLESVYRWAADVEKEAGSLVKMVRFGTSRGGHPLLALEFDADPATSKPVFWFDGGIHGNEPIGVEAIKDLAARLRNRSNPEVQDWLSKYKFVLVPVLNPDGYDLSATRIAWRKNGRRLPNGNVAGIDLNRAFPTRTPYRAPALDPYSKEWMPADGDREPEVQATMAYARQVKPVGAINFHSNAHFISYADTVPGSADEGFYRALASEMGKVIRDEKEATGTYLTGTPMEIFAQLNGTRPGPLRGPIIEWMWENFGTLALAIELLDYNSSVVWPAADVRAKAVAGAFPAVETFVNRVGARQRK